MVKLNGANESAFGASLNDYLQQVSAAGRHAVSRKDWASVAACANELVKKDSNSAEGHFLQGLLDKASGNSQDAIAAFDRALQLNSDRYDAAVELANQFSAERRNSEAAAVLNACVDKLAASPMYLNMAGTVYSQIGMAEQALPLFEKANELQPGIDKIESNLATTYVVLGKIDDARVIYQKLLQRHPTHQQFHYKLAVLDKASDASHIEAMQQVLAGSRQPPDKNVFLYYAIGKENEDLQRWDEAFEYFEKAGDAVASVSQYDVEADIQLIDTIIETCNAEWLRSEPSNENYGSKSPIFVVGLPRTGTTLTDRILSSHSQVQSAGETQFMQMVVRRESGIVSDEKITPEMIVAAAAIDIRQIGNGYIEMLSYRLGEESIFVDKLPFNMLYLGFIAKAFPDARIVHIRRNPMDSCFAMYKQLFTWAYKFSYTLDGLARFYPAYLRLLQHWQELLGDRIVELEYEVLVNNQESETRRLLKRLDLPFEESCLNFQNLETATATASFAQVREKIHTRSVDRWRRYANQLEPLRDALVRAGVVV